MEETFQIQEHLVEIKLEEGYQLLGPKMGLTSQAKMKQMNIESSEKI